MDDVDVDWGLDDDGYDDDCLSVGGDDGALNSGLADIIEELADDTKTNPMKPQEVALTEEAKRNGERRSEQRGTENNEEKYLEDREEKLEKHVEESSTTKEMRPEGKPESMSNPTSSKTASNPAAVQTPRSYQQAVSPPPPKSKASSPPQRSILSVRDRRAPSHETSPHGLQAESRDGPRRQEPRNDSHRESDRRGGKARPVDERHDKARMDDKTRRTGWEPDERREVRLERHRAAWREDEVRSLRSSDDGYHLKGAFQQPLHNSTDGLPEGWRRIVPEKAFREGIPIPVAPQGGPGPFFYRHEETGVGQWEKPMGKSVDKPTEQVHEPNPTDQTGHVDRSKDNRRNGSEEPKSVSKQNDPQERDHNRPTGHVATSATYFRTSRGSSSRRSRQSPGWRLRACSLQRRAYRSQSGARS
ncbi:hypothetical protein CC85DRAFT_60814 [Cutaneotrichosporon oleaginosum]|uniref:WW domain-containing protein n=1 Tax=Cutaneotrichosporon oleaginosum TaxID=879819 RepID=A0A0J0XQ88_9TREE|nr:uncharacterized protein CC85DRAFT_60814 [Cutaneotrichosporon oleaginosum]KLT43286.1 hypothetical protein CC85DRAFT_60814 [Cutaneotrichosporon oleaginosum]TXT14451.1 hypothetical protein COLE_00644 [Cutaneotrichosporon oleaginosum]